MKASNHINKILSTTTLSALVSASLLAVLPSHATTNDGGPITKDDLRQNGFQYPTDLVPSANQTQLANYAWRLFIASNQLTAATLTNGAGRGHAVSNQNFIDTGKTPNFSNPLVFESLYHRTEAFPYYVLPKTQANIDAGANYQNSENPNLINQPRSPIGNAPIYYTFYETGTAPNLLNHQFTVPNGQYVNLDETNEIGQNFLYYQNSNDQDFPVLYMAKVNDTEVRYVYNQPFQPSNSRSFIMPNETLEVKSAWRRVRDIKNSDPSTYHQAVATYYVANGDGKPNVVSETFAMVALHIIQKTANYQSFIFTTFEHVDSVTRDGNGVITDPAYKTTYNKLQYNNGTPTSYTAIATGAYGVNAPGQPTATNTQHSYNLPNAGPISMDFTTVVQPDTITSQVNDVNNQVAATIKDLDSDNIWANYRLKGVQAVPTSDQTTLDYYLANIVVESSQPGIQLFSGGVRGPDDNLLFINDRDNGDLSGNISLGLTYNGPVPKPTYTMGGCQGCHGRAQQRGRDFSFLASSVLGHGREVDSVPSPALNPAEAAAMNASMAKSSAVNAQ